MYLQRYEARSLSTLSNLDSKENWNKPQTLIYVDDMELKQT